MVKLRNPFKKRDDYSLDDAQLKKELREEGGLRTISGAAHLQKRLEFNDKAIKDIIESLDAARQVILAKNARSVEDDALLDKYTREIEEWILYRSSKSSAAPWQIAAEDKDLSHRWRSMELAFFRRKGRESHHGLILACLSYMGDISFRDKHVAAPSPIIIHSQILPGHTSVDPNAIIGQSKTENTRAAH